MTEITPEAVKAALEAGEPHCTKCGHKRSEHHYRHPFQPSHTTTLESMAPDLATAYLALAEEIERLRKRVEATDRLAARLKESASGWQKVCLSQSSTLCDYPCGWCRNRATEEQR